MSPRFGRFAGFLARLRFLLPALALTALAAFIDHPAALLPLLLAQPLYLAAIVGAFGYLLDADFAQLALRRGTTYFVVLLAYAAFVALVVGTPTIRLGRRSLGAQRRAALPRHRAGAGRAVAAVAGVRPRLPVGRRLPARRRTLVDRDRDRALLRVRPPPHRRARGLLRFRAAGGAGHAAAGGRGPEPGRPHRRGALRTAALGAVAVCAGPVPAGARPGRDPHRTPAARRRARGGGAARGQRARGRGRAGGAQAGRCRDPQRAGAGRRRERAGRAGAGPARARRRARRAAAPARPRPALARDHGRDLRRPAPAARADRARRGPRSRGGRAHAADRRHPRQLPGPRRGGDDPDHQWRRPAARRCRGPHAAALCGAVVRSHGGGGAGRRRRRSRTR